MRSAALGCLVLLFCASVQAVIVSQFNVSWRYFEYPSPTVVLLHASDGNVYRSSNEGQDWSVLAQASDIYTFPSDNQSYLFPNGATFSATSNGGLTLTNGNFPFSPHRIITNGVRAGWILILSCSSQPCAMQYSKDYGASWTSGAAIFGYSSPIGYGVSADQPDTIFGIKYSNDGTFGYTNNYQSFTKLFSRSAGFVLTDNFMFVGVVPSNNNGIVLYSSSKYTDPTFTKSSNYKLDSFPFGEDLPDQGYTFLDDSARAEFLGLWEGQSAYWGTLYTSNSQGGAYALSLDYLACQPEYLLYDFDKVRGFPGIYLANSYPTATGSEKQTRITYDNGGAWRRLAAPTLDYSGKPLNCYLSQNCSLHLHGLISYYNITVSTAPFYSSRHAIGLIVGVGNTGTSVSHDRNYLSTYLSRDAGLTWTVIYPSPTIYEFGDHGAILVFATTESTTTSIYYSTNEGLTVESFEFTDTAVWVKNIITEPSGTGRKFDLLALSTDQQSIIFGLDFSDSNLPPCTDSDYENWSPSNGETDSNQNCFMGAKTVYVRRKQTSQCYNDRSNTDKPTTSTPCTCDYMDFECDEGFTPSRRNISNGYFTCSKNSGEQQPDCSSGYRLVPDTQCKVGDLNLAAASCKKTSSAVTTVVVMLTITFIAIAGVGIAYWKNEGFRALILSRLGSSRSSGYSRVHIQEQDDLIE